MKKPLQSKTVWVNMLVVAAAALAGVMNVEFVVNNPAVVASLGAAVGIVNIVLRLFTSEPLR